jgi:VanZ family protein
MRGEMKQALLKYGPAAAWFALIFTLTSVPSPHVSVGIPHFDKIIHFGIYLPFGFLLMRAAGSGSLKRLALAFAVCLLAAACDELHQLIIPGREADLFDFSADMAGAALGMILWCLLRGVTRPPGLHPKKPVSS